MFQAARVKPSVCDNCDYSVTLADKVVAAVVRLTVLLDHVLCVRPCSVS